VLFLLLRGPERRSFTFSPSTAALPAVGSVVVVRGGTQLRAAAFEGASPAATREAGRIASSNATLAGLVRRGDGRRLGTASRWTSIGSNLLGAVIGYRLRRAIAVDSDLPYVAIPPDAPAHGTCVVPYASGWAHLRGTGITALFVLVDLRRGRVVEIDTNAERGTVGPVPGKPYPTCNEDQTG